MKTNIAALLRDLHEIPIMQAVKTGNLPAFKRMTGKGIIEFSSLEWRLGILKPVYIRVDPRDYRHWMKR